VDKESLEAKKAHAEKEISQLENRHAVPLIHQPFTAPIGGSGYGGFADTPLDDLNGTVKDCYVVHPPFCW